MPSDLVCNRHGRTTRGLATIRKVGEVGMRGFILPTYTDDEAETCLRCNMQELVRCKDCVYWQDNNDGYPHIGCKWREDETPDPDDFCSAGEVREC